MAKKHSTEVFQNLSGQDANVEDICRAVAADFKRQGLSQKEAADKLGLEKRAVSNQISGKRPFARKTAKLYSIAFGYNEEFLVKGKGRLFDESPESAVPQTVTLTLKRYTELIRENAELKAIVKAAIESQIAKSKLGVSALGETALTSGQRSPLGKGSKDRLAKKPELTAIKKGGKDI